MKKNWIILGLTVVAFVAVALISGDRFVQDVIITILIFAAYATAWNLAGGMAGLFSLGHAALFAAGAYGTTLLRLEVGLPTLVALPVAALLATLIAALIGVMSLRLKGHYFALATLGLGVIVFILLQNLSSITGGDEGIVIPYTAGPEDLVFSDKMSYVFLSLGLFALTAAVFIAVRYSKLGYQLLAVREDEVSARAMGIRATRAKMIAVSLSGFLTGLAGGIFAQYSLYITPINAGSVDISWQPALMAIIGGMGSVWGPLLGSTLLTTLEQSLITIIGADVAGLNPLIYGLLLIVCILLLPNGIIGFLKDLKGKYRPGEREEAERHAHEVEEQEASEVLKHGNRQSDEDTTIAPVKEES